MNVHGFVILNIILAPKDEIEKEIDMKIIVAGGDGFCGWPTALYLSKQGHDVVIVDNLIRRVIDGELKANSVLPIQDLSERVHIWQQVSGCDMSYEVGDINDYDFLAHIFQTHRPHAFVHYAEQRSAPYSMISRRHAVYTQKNNVVGTLNVLYAIHEFAPDCHLIKLGSMGEYGTPNIDIEEGYLNVTHNGRTERFLYPKTPMSFYHLSKVHDSYNIHFAAKIWGLRATDLNQGVVYGIHTDETRLDRGLLNRLDYDGVYGTALNRFIIQAAIGEGISVYGKGGQLRGFINIMDTVRCIALAAEYPAEPGEMRVVNQFTESFSVLELAERVARVAENMGLSSKVEHVSNPRVEKEAHYFNAKNTQLSDWGLHAHLLTDDLIAEAIEEVQRYKDRIIKERLLNSPNWRK